MHYNLIVAHAGGDKRVLSNANSLGLDHFNIDTWDDSGYSFRDKVRNKTHSWEHCLFARGTELKNYALEKGIDISADPEKDYLLRFTEDGTPSEGEDCDWVNIHFIEYGKKETRMVYDEVTGLYVYNQYGKEMADGQTGEPEGFRNVIIMMIPVTRVPGGYQTTDFLAGGEGYFACGGKLIPILWSCDGDLEPFRFTTRDGQPLLLGVGNTYIALAPLQSEITWE